MDLMKVDPEDIDLIVETYPSKCWLCKNARRVVNQEQGYVGCTMPMKHYKTFEKDYPRIKAEKKGRGMIDLHGKPFMMPSSSGASAQLITRGVTFCPNFDN